MRRIKNRVFDLEAATTATGAASAAGQRMLVEILARRDALFWPWRTTTAESDLEPMPAIRERQNAFLERREGVAVKADGKGDWKSASATRLELAGAKLVEPIFASGQVQSLMLTDLGEALARSLVGCRLKNLDQAAYIFSRLLQCEEVKKPVGEGRLFGKTLAGSPSDWEHWLEPCLPLLTSGFVTATSDTQGRIVFSSKASSLPKAVKFDIAEPLEGADDVYVSAFQSERETLAKLSGGCDIFVPLPAMAGL